MPPPDQKNNGMDKNDIQCERIGDLVYIKCDGIVIMIASAHKRERYVVFCNNLNWNEIQCRGKTSVEDMEMAVKESLKFLEIKTIH